MRFAQSQGHQVQMEKQAAEFHLMIQKGAEMAETEDQPIVCETPQERATVVYISSEGVGRGDEQLGSILMAAYLDTLSQFATQISHVIFVNAGVKLAVEDSPVLEQIQGLERVGVQISCCGTCLRHFGVQEKLKAGSVSNMYAILEVLSAAGKVMSP
jgi:selenium metabolism protein YedF